MPFIPYTKNRPSSLTLTSQYYVKFNDQPDALQSTNVNVVTLGSTFSGFKQPGWRRVIRDGGNATTGATGSKVTQSSPYSYGTMTVNYGTNNVYKYTLIGHIAGNISLDYPISFGGSLPLSEIVGLANVSFLQKCLRAQQQFSSGVFLGELRETLHLIRNPAASLRKLYSDFVNSCRNRNDTHMSRRQRSRMIAQTWLEYAFGVVPLLSDIEGGVNALNRFMKNKPTQYVTSTVSRDYWGDVLVKNIDLVSNFVISARLIRKAMRRGGRSIRGEVRLRQNGDLGSYPEALGLRIRDFVPTIYQLIPYSFLVDYFTNIGDLIEAASFNQAELQWYCVSDFSEDECTWLIQPRRISSYAGSPVIDYFVEPSESTYKSKSFARTIPLNLDLPPLGVQVDVGWRKAFNIAALASLKTL